MVPKKKKKQRKDTKEELSLFDDYSCDTEKMDMNGP